MNIEVQVSMTRALFNATLRTRWSGTLWGRLLPGAVVLAIGAVVLILGGYSPWGVGLVGGGLALLVRQLWFPALVYRRMMRRVSPGSWTYQLTDDELVQTTPAATVRWPWSSVRWVKETDGLWGFRLPNGVIGLPKEVFDAEQDAQLRAFLMQRRLIPA